MTTGRELKRQEIDLIWTIDRSEEIDAIYYYEHGELVLKPEVYHMHSWPPGEVEKYTPLLEECFDSGGWFYGLFDHNRMVGAAVLEHQFIGRNRDLLQLKFLHVGNGYRNMGLGKMLFDLAREKAKQRGAKGLYISATPSENTIHFYLHRGCVIAPEPDPQLFELEPEDIHLIYAL